jgi:hypothetical protein
MLAITSALPVVGAAADARESLLTNSPFGVAGKSEAPTASSLEFRGFVQEGDVRFFNLYDPASKVARWVAIDADNGGIKIHGYDEVAQQLKVSQGSKQLTLTLKKAAVLLAAAPAPETGPATSSPNGFTLAPDDKANMQKIAEEIRRRRALRAQTETPPPSESPAPKSAE